MTRKSNYHNAEFAEKCSEISLDQSELFWTGRDDKKDGYYFATILSSTGHVIEVFTYFDKQEFQEDIKTAQNEFNLQFIKQ